MSKGNPPPPLGPTSQAASVTAFPTTVSTTLLLFSPQRPCQRSLFTLLYAVLSSGWMWKSISACTKILVYTMEASYFTNRGWVGREIFFIGLNEAFLWSLRGICALEHFIFINFRPNFLTAAQCNLPEETSWPAPVVRVTHLHENRRTRRHIP